MSRFELNGFALYDHWFVELAFCVEKAIASLFGCGPFLLLEIEYVQVKRLSIL